MKYGILALTALVVLLMSVNGYAADYDATGMWNYTESDLIENCPSPYVLVSSEIGILQDGDTFIIVGEDYSTQGTVSGDTYISSEKWQDVYDGTVVNISSQTSITLSSPTDGSGSTIFTATWTEGGGGSCNGSFTSSVTRDPPADPVYDATGIWNFELSNIYYDCGTGPDATSGYFDVVQTGSRIIATDNFDNEFEGFVNGAQYGMLWTYPENGGRTTEKGLITLSSPTQGSGEAGFVWDDDYDNCGGNWNIEITLSTASTTTTSTTTTTTTSTTTTTTLPPDLCPADPDKTEPGICGCGEPDTDSDGDGNADCLDTDIDGDGIDNTDEIYCGSDPTDPDSVCARGLAWLSLLLDEDNSVEADSDGDGFSNTEEIQCSSDPADPNSSCSQCKKIGESCFGPQACCSGVCDSDGSGAGVCVELSGCLPSGENCLGPRICCSNVCIDDGSGGVCIKLDVCSPIGELCSTNDECCSETCELFPDSTLGRCQNTPGCQEPGEICGEGASTNCCGPDGVTGSSEYCHPDPTFDISRCVAP